MSGANIPKPKKDGETMRLLFLFWMVSLLQGAALPCALASGIFLAADRPAVGWVALGLSVIFASLGMTMAQVLGEHRAEETAGTSLQPERPRE
jgi:hypothetical protein